MKFLICGLGSIGQRHVRMIHSVLGNAAEIAAFRSRRLDVVISDTLDASFGSSPEQHYGLRAFYDLGEALAWRPDAVFITNPIGLHVPTALAAARAGCHLFIEKPLGHDETGVEELAREVASRELVCMVGYQLRYHPAYQRIRALIQSGALGRLASADLHFGEWLPGMHPYEDYRESHAARADQGGGVLLCLSHEIDLAAWLFGAPRAVYASGGHLSDLEIDVEDTADLLLTCLDEGRPFPVHVHLDFLQAPARRYAHIVGQRGSLIFDYPTNTLAVRRLPSGTVETITFDGFQRNDMFRQEVAEFIAAVQGQRRAPIPLEAGVTALRVCLAAKASLASGRPEALP